jgi:CelD/BcsL family acetyltransferase involved in cellulose biosynthesis
MIQVQLVDVPDVASLAVDWRALESSSDVSFFTSWSWIGSWLASLPATLRPRLLGARQQGQIAGLALLGQRRSRRHGFVHSRSLHLHSTGEPVHDAIAVEYNGFLVDQACAADVQAAMLDHLVHQVHDWDEVYLPGLAQPPAGIAALPTAAYRSEHKPAFLVDLALVRERQGDYPALLSRHTRYQIRKSEKAFARLGPIALDAASTTEQALHYLQALEDLHQPYWIGRGEPGAFASAFARQFHRHLVGTAFERGEIQLLRVTVGEQVLGYLYNFVHRGHVYNYQTGIDYSLLEGSVSPGLVCHARAVAHCAALGLEVYDFMAGEQRYKRTLSTRSTDMSWGVLQRDRLRFRAEDALRAISRRLRACQQRKRGAAASPARVAG